MNQNTIAFICDLTKVEPAKHNTLHEWFQTALTGKSNVSSYLPNGNLNPSFRILVFAAYIIFLKIEQPIKTDLLVLDLQL